MSQRDWRRRERLFQEAFDLTAETSAAALPRRVLDLACTLGQADHGSLTLFGPDGDAEVFRTTDDLEEGRRVDRSLVEAGAMARVAREGVAVRVTGPSGAADRLGPPGGSGAPLLGVPITVWGRVCGIVCLARSQGSPPFDEEDEEQTVWLGGQAGVALDHARLLQEGRVRERALMAVNELSHAILGGTPTDEVLGLVARSARSLAGASMAFVTTPDPAAGLLVVRAAAGPRAEAAVGTTFPQAGSISDEVMASGRPLLIEDAASDRRRAQPMVRIGGVGPALFVPLAVADRVFGTLSVANDHGGRPFSRDDLLVVETFAAEAAVALQYAQVHAELERLSLLEERERIAMDLHDGVIQALFVVGLSLQAAQAVAADPEAVAVSLADAVGSIDRAIRDLRDYIFGLQPEEKADHQLERALRDVAAGLRRSSGVTTLVEVDPEAASLLAPGATDLTHLAREAMCNAVRHSGGDRVALTLRLADDEVTLEVSDNGSGFDPHRALGQGNGLSNLRSRAESLGGKLEIDSESGAGSTVRLRVPR